MHSEMLLLKAPEQVAQWKRSPEFRYDWRSCGKIGMFCIKQLICDEMIGFRPVHNYRKDKIKLLMCSKSNLSVAASHTNVLSEESFQVFSSEMAPEASGRRPVWRQYPVCSTNSHLALLTGALLHPGNGTHHYYHYYVFCLHLSFWLLFKFKGTMAALFPVTL